MAVPSTINDGNFNLREPYSIEYDFPFAEKGDNVSFVADVKFIMDKPAYRPLASMSQMNFANLGVGYLVNPGKPRDIGNGLYEFTERYFSLPVNRYEYGSFTYTLQSYASVSSTGVNPDKYFYDVSWDLEENTFTVPAQFRFEYFLNQKPPPLLKSRLFMQFGRLYSINGTPANGSLIVADDSQVSIYGAYIYERKTPFVQVTSNQIPNP